MALLSAGPNQGYKATDLSENPDLSPISLGLGLVWTVAEEDISALNLETSK